MLQSLVALASAPAWAGEDKQVNSNTRREPHNAVVNPRDPSQVAVMQGCTVYIDNNYGEDGFPIRRSTSISGCFGDPSLAFDSQGRLFATHLSTSFNADGASRFGVGVGEITDLTTTGNQQYTPTQVSADTTANNDKQWLVADANPSSPYADNLYIVWTRLGGPRRVMFSRSTDSGANWSTPVEVSEAGEGAAWPAHLAVAANGDLYVAYHTNTCEDEDRTTAEGPIETVPLIRDGSGGADLAAGTIAQRTDAFGPGEASVTCNVQGTGDEIPRTDFWMQGSNQAWVLPDPARPGHVYVVANDNPDNVFGTCSGDVANNICDGVVQDPGDDADVVIARSANNGLDFTTSRVDHGPGETFAVLPTAHIDQDGTIVATWYDNRLGTTNGGSGPNGNDNFLLELYGTTSRDGGQTWSPDFRISDDPFDPDVGASCRFGSNTNCGTVTTEPQQTLRIGEYNGLWTANGIGYATWTGNTTPPGAGGAGAAAPHTIYYDVFSLLGASPDALEPNESIDTAVAAGLGNNDKFNKRRLTLHSATDVDFFRVEPRHTGHLRVEIDFSEVISDLQVRAYDRFGNEVATGTVGTTRTGSSTSEFAIPVVEDGKYFIAVGDAGIGDPTSPGDASPSDPPQATYDLTVVNRAAPEPFGIDLTRASDSGRFDNDDVTGDTGPVLRLRVDDSALLGAGIKLSPQNATADDFTDDDAGFKVAVEADGKRVGLAQPVDPADKPGIYEVTLDQVLFEGESLITAEVVIVDPSDDPATTDVDHDTDSGKESAHRLGLTLDTTPPGAPGAPDLLPSSDTGGITIDNITTLTTPAFQGSGVERNTLVRLLADPAGPEGPFVVGKDTATSGGAYEIVSDPLGDGVYVFTVQLEDLAGNVTTGLSGLQVTIAHKSLTLSGATEDVVVDIAEGTVTGYPGIPGGVIGIEGVPTVRLDASGNGLSVVGGAADESLTFTPTSADGGRLTRAGTAPVLNVSGVDGPVGIALGSGDDVVTLRGTTGADSITGTVDTLALLAVEGLLGLEIVTAEAERIAVVARDGKDTVDLTVMDTVSTRLSVDAGPPTTAPPPQGDELIVRAGSPQGQVNKSPGGPNTAQGSVFVTYPQTTDAETRVDYTEAEKLDLAK
ncbi:Ig-like domain-containing protein [Streptomyces sp. E11-3]|uniref:Ig-like domain-containing protein n=1 Tax=Streptomyces sp. E11-3 TaxID=3110112 RepID=UPI003980E6A1